MICYTYCTEKKSIWFHHCFFGGSKPASGFLSLFASKCILVLKGHGAYKVSMLTHTYPQNSGERLSKRQGWWPGLMAGVDGRGWRPGLMAGVDGRGWWPGLTAHVTCGLMSVLICELRKEDGHTWHRMSILKPDVIKQHKRQCCRQNKDLWGLRLLLVQPGTHK